MAPTEADFDKALGTFAKKIAQIETNLFSTISAMSDVDLVTLSNLNTTWRVANSIDIIKRFLELAYYHDKEKAEIRECLEHLVQIEQFRNGILHGITVKPTGLIRRYLGKAEDHDFGAEFLATNLTTARNAELAKNYPVSVSILQNASSDVERIRARLMVFEYAIRARRDPNRTKKPPGWCEVALMLPWRYIPPKPESKRQPRA
jgi:hypothetical protein